MESRAPNLTRLRSSGDGSSPRPAQRRRAAQSLASALGREAPVSQERAKEWFYDANARRLGCGAFGATRVLKHPPSGMDIVIKKVTDDGGIDEFCDTEGEKKDEWGESDENMGAMFREWAQKEYDAHIEAWDRFSRDPPCAEFLAEPAKMTFETDPSAGSYLVQAYASVAGLKTMALPAFGRLLEAPGRRLHKNDKLQIAHSFGKLLGCLANARMLHKDMNEQNVLLLNNLEDAEASEFRFAWRLIDWGGGEPVAALTPGRAIEMCFDAPEPGDALIPGFRLVDDPSGTCHHEHEGRYGVVKALHEMLRGDDETERLQFVEVVEWVRGGYVAQTRLAVPPSVVAAAMQRLDAERAARQGSGRA